MKPSVAFLAALSIAVPAAVPGAQQKSQTAVAPYVETFDVQINNVDVVVTDRHGHPVSGLTRDDFEVRENGVVQPITNFSVYSHADSTSAPEDSRPPVARKFVFVIDELSLDPGVQRTLQAQMHQFASTMMRAGDEAMIVTPNGTQVVRMSFTADRAEFLARADAVVAASRFRVDTELNKEWIAYLADVGYPPSIGVRDRQLSRHIYADRVTRRVERMLGHVQSLVSALAEVPGKKVVVLMTESLPATPGSELYRPWYRDELRSLGRQIDRIAQTASTNGIAIYCLQPSYGFQFAVPGPSVEDRRNISYMASYQLLRDTLQNTEDTMNILSGRTGGRWWRGVNGIGQLFAGVESDLSTYYSLGYRAPETKRDTPYRIDVRVKERPDLNVRARRDVIRKSPEEEMNDLVVASLVDPKSVNELGIAAKAGTPVKSHGAYKVPVEVHIPIASLTLLPDGSKYRGRFTVHYAAVAARGDFSSGVERQGTIEIPAAEIEKARAHEWTYTSELLVPPGEVTIAVGVLDPTSRLSSFRTLEVTAR